MLDFRVVIAACVAGVVILLGGIGLVASVRIAQEPVRSASRIVERPRAEPNASLPVVIQTPAVKRAPPREVARPPEPVAAPEPVVPPVVTPIVTPIEARAPAPAPVQPAATETTGSITPQPAPVAPAPPAPARASPAPAVDEMPTTVPVEHPQATSGLPPSRTAAKKTPRRPRPAAPRPVEPQNPFSAIFGGFN